MKTCKQLLPLHCFSLLAKGLQSQAWKLLGCSTSRAKQHLAPGLGMPIAGPLLQWSMNGVRNEPRSQDIVFPWLKKILYDVGPTPWEHWRNGTAAQCSSVF